MLTGLKNFCKQTQQWICSKFSLKMPQHVKCLATVIYDLPLITIPVSNCHLFSDINSSQSSVATRLRCGGIFSYHFTANLSPSLTMKEFWKSVKIWPSYCHEFCGPVFFGTHAYKERISWRLKKGIFDQVYYNVAISVPRRSQRNRSRVDRLAPIIYCHRVPHVGGWSVVDRCTCKNTAATHSRWGLWRHRWRSRNRRTCWCTTLRLDRRESSTNTRSRLYTQRRRLHVAWQWRNFFAPAVFPPLCVSSELCYMFIIVNFCDITFWVRYWRCGQFLKPTDSILFE